MDSNFLPAFPNLQLQCNVPVKDDAFCDLEVFEDELLEELSVHVGPATLEI